MTATYKATFEVRFENEKIISLVIRFCFARCSDFPAKFVEPISGEETSYKICVDAFMKKLTMAQKIERIEKFDFLPFRGPVKLNNPDIIFSLFEFFGPDQNNLPELPERIFFGRCVGEGQRELISK